MVDDAADQERAREILGELAELGLMLARELAVQARAAEATEEKAVLTGAFQKISRTVRLTLALKFKLSRDAARDAAEAARQEKADAADTALRESRIMKAAQAAHVSMTDPSPIEIQKRRVTSAMTASSGTNPKATGEAASRYGGRAAKRGPWRSPIT